VEWSGLDLLLLLVAVFLGTVVQGTLGFGLVLILAPVATLVLPESLPVAAILVTLPLSLFLVVKEVRAVDVHGLTYLVLGRVVGSVLGVGLLTLVPAGYLSVFFGGCVIAAVLASVVSGPKLDPDRRTQTAGGVASGIMGTAAGIGGPPLALVYQNRSGAEIRGTLAATFSIGGVISLLALTLAHRVTPAHLLLSLELLPALVLGLLVANRLARILADARWLRPAVLLFAGLSGLAAVLLGLF
jgi:uncharacterized membrane protein YfcA